MDLKYTVENLKCRGCTSTIRKGLLAMAPINKVSVDIDQSEIIVTTDVPISNEIIQKLAALGYPVLGAKNTVIHKAKSVVSCALGRVSKEN